MNCLYELIERHGGKSAGFTAEKPEKKPVAKSGKKTKEKQSAGRSAHSGKPAAVQLREAGSRMLNSADWHGDR